MGVVVVVVVASEQWPFGSAQHLDDAVVGFEDVRADEFGEAAFRGEETGVIDRRDQLEAVLVPGDVVVLRRVPERYGPLRCRSRGDKERIDDPGCAVEERVAGVEAEESLAFEVSVARRRRG